MQTSEESIGLMSLPPELRNRIYELVVPGDGKVAEIPMGKIPGTLYPAPPKNVYGIPSLCQVSHHIRGETLSIFYSTQRFEFCAPATGALLRQPAPLTEWMQSLDFRHTKHIKNVKIVYQTYLTEQERASELLTRRKVLKALECKKFGLHEDASRPVTEFPTNRKGENEKDIE